MISLIAVVGKNNELGKNNDLIWHLPNDLKFFKEQTINRIVVMGYNTFISLGRPLPNRINVVLSSDKVDLPIGVLQFNNLEDLNDYICDKDVFIIGGASLYKQFIDQAKRIYLTEVEATSDADVYFPKFVKTKYKKTVLGKNSDNNIDKETIRVNFDSIGLDAINILIYMYTDIIDYAEYLIFRENVNKEILKVLESENVKMAYPGQNVYIHQIQEKNKEFNQH